MLFGAIELVDGVVQLVATEMADAHDGLVHVARETGPVVADDEDGIKDARSREVDADEDLGGPADDIAVQPLSLAGAELVAADVVCGFVGVALDIETRVLVHEVGDEGLEICLVGTDDHDLFVGA